MSSEPVTTVQDTLPVGLYLLTECSQL